MPSKTDKLIASNYKYYFSSSYAKFLRKHTMIISLVTAVLIGISITMMKCIIMKYGIIEKAGYIDLGEQEVMDWAVIEARRSIYDINTGIIVLFTIAFIMFIIITYTRIKSYKLYKMKKVLFTLPLFFGIITMAVLYLSIYKQLGYISRQYIYCTLAITVEMLAVLTSLRKFIPLEIKSEYESIFSLYDILSRYILKKL